MSELTELFKETVKNVKAIIKKRPSNEDLLIIYSLYKQAAEGDCKAEEPNIFDVVGISKYNAWKELQGMPKEEAMRKYINKVEEIQKSQKMKL